MAREKVAIVTGSSSGIGLLTAVELALNGYRVVATMRNLESRGRLEEAAQKAGVRDRLDLRRLDITEFDSLPGAVDAMVRDHGRVEVLVNNAGFSVAG
ncbi:MAG TPA: SDR family NAD(P)-dependent oxidoreductase, partial [Geobacterales bacterium]|nr:SDR family NAD(P)-dependent oxidoreductase [Geobacterales bacterium]